MKIGFRTPSLKKSIKARTTGKLKRKVKSAVNPLYGKKGMGVLHPKRALYNKVYNKVTIDPLKKLRSPKIGGFKTSSTQPASTSNGKAREIKELHVLAVNHPELGECYAAKIQSTGSKTADLTLNVEFNKATVFSGWDEINKIRGALPYDSAVIEVNICDECKEPFSIEFSQKKAGQHVCSGCELAKQQEMIDSILDGRNLVLVGIDDIDRKIIFCGFEPHASTKNYTDWRTRADWMPITDDLYVPETNIYHFADVKLAEDFVRKTNCTGHVRHIHAFPEDICSICKKRFVDTSRKPRQERVVCHECFRKYSKAKTNTK